MGISEATSYNGKKKDTLTRKRMIDDFESVDGFNVIIISPIAAGVGLTVVGAKSCYS